jgi:hypothetical protein
LNTGFSFPPATKSTRFFELTGNVFGTALSARVSSGLHYKTDVVISGEASEYTPGTQQEGVLGWSELAADIVYHTWWTVGTRYPISNTATYIGVINAP